MTYRPGYSQPYLDVSKDLEYLGFSNAVPNVAGGGDAIQDAIDLFIADPKWSYIYIPPGVWRTTAPLLVAQDSTFCRVVMRGSTASFTGNSRFFGGSIIQLEGDGYQDLPVLFQQGGRACVYEGIQFYNTGNPRPQDMNQSDVSHLWLNPELSDWVEPGVRTNVYSPHAAVVIDPFMPENPGNDINNCYPGYESHYGGVSNSSPTGSLGTKFVGCSFRGAYVGVVLSPPGTGISSVELVQQNDQSTFEDCYFYHNAIHYSHAQSQSRQNVLNQCKFNNAWLAIDTGNFGPAGIAPPPIVNDPLFTGIRYLFNFVLQSQSFTCPNLYMENVCSLGRLAANLSSGNYNATFISGEFNFKSARNSGAAANEPEIDYHAMGLTNTTFIGSVFRCDDTRGPIRFWNNGGNWLFLNCTFVDQDNNDFVQVGFDKDDSSATYAILYSKFRNTTARLAKNPKDTRITKRTRINNSNTITLVQDGTVKSRATGSIADTTGLEVGQLVSVNNLSNPNLFVPQVLDPYQFQTYNMQGPVGVITSITTNTSITVEGLPYSFPFNLPLVLDTFSWEAESDDFVVTATSSITARLETTTLCDASGGAFTVTLPSVVDSVNGKLIIKKIDSSSNAITVDGNGPEVIDGQATQTLSSQYDTITLLSSGAGWYII